MATCASCGRDPGPGRFCTQCGARQEEWRTDTAERPALREEPPGRPEGSSAQIPWGPPSSPPSEPPSSAPSSAPPSAPPSAEHAYGGPRFPLYADQDATGGAPAGGPDDREHTRPLPVPPPPAGGPAPTPAPSSLPFEPARQPSVQPPVQPPAEPVGARRSRRTPWLLLALVLVLVLAAGGLWLALSPGDGERPADGAGGDQAPVSAPENPSDLTRQATASAPQTAPPNQDTQGNMVRYEARNMLDGVRSTCWRMPGDGTDQELTFRFPHQVTLTEVGLVNGYAKTATDQRGRTLDWYHGNRREVRVEWVFDDGSTVEQDLGDSTDMQTVEIDPVRTRTVRLRLVEVSDPGKGPAARNYTPISDVSLVGG